VTPPGVYPSPCGDDVCMPISLGEWFLSFWDTHVERRTRPDVSKRPLECTACPGDLLFVPHGWWHLVLNIGDSDSISLNDRGMSVALTRNYVSASNLSDVLRFLDTRKSQISGCRDRSEAIQPDELGDEFRKALSRVEHCQHADDEEKKDCDNGLTSLKGRWTALLEKAEIKAKKGWACAAWTDIAQESSCFVREQNSTEHKSSILERAKQGVDSNTEFTAAGSSGGFTFSFLC
jgi:hypothetical protein